MITSAATSCRIEQNRFLLTNDQQIVVLSSVPKQIRAKSALVLISKTTTINMSCYAYSGGWRWRRRGWRKPTRDTSLRTFTRIRFKVQRLLLLVVKALRASKLTSAIGVKSGVCAVRLAFMCRAVSDNVATTVAIPFTILFHSATSLFYCPVVLFVFIYVHYGTCWKTDTRLRGKWHEAIRERVALSVMWISI